MRRFGPDGDGLSTVGTMLMVAITVLLASVVYVQVRGSATEQKDIVEHTAVSLRSPLPNQITVTLAFEGDHGPYGLDDVLISVDNQPCTLGGSDAMGQVHDNNGDGYFGAGDWISFDHDCQQTPAVMQSGSIHLVDVAIHGTPVAQAQEVHLR